MSKPTKVSQILTKFENYTGTGYALYVAAEDLARYYSVSTDFIFDMTLKSKEEKSILLRLAEMYSRAGL